MRRPAARVVCLDPVGRVLLLHWRDPGSGSGTRIWEPPGGGVEAGESDLDAAGRELWEETGLRLDLRGAPGVRVDRDFWWNGTHYVGPEWFCLARVAGTPAVEPVALTASEAGTYLGHGWFEPDQLGQLDDRLEPPDLAAVLASLLDTTTPTNLSDPPQM